MMKEEKINEPKSQKIGEKVETWKEICEYLSYDDLYEYNTNDRAKIEDYFSADIDIFNWLNEHPDDSFYFTIRVCLGKYAECSVGIWGVEVSPSNDNRGWEDDDYNAVLKWLNKVAGEKSKKEEVKI